MAKRRNLKKEKALRNEAYARKFRKRPSKGRFGRRRPFGNDNRAEDTENMQEPQD
ncbi:hypothetical protein [Leptolyngbya sp. 'hensonii']|uniref:hypothetical protein n=1 Tax=Leptolyngbya sp. 'hensonii' TaxID=1922337 RepID=UPI000AFDC3C6|nr:hypothetical protein [Leptolyngbya sp. 'hensonii']